MENIKDMKLNKTPVRTFNSLKLNDIVIENLNIPEINEFKNVNVINENLSGIGIFDLILNKKENLSEELNVRTLQNFQYSVNEILLNQALEYCNQKYVIQIDESLENSIYINYELDDNNLSLVDNVTVIANENTSATIYLKYSSKNNKFGYHNGILNIIAKKNSNIKIVVVNFLKKANHFYSISKNIEEKANVEFINIDLGGKYSITNLFSNLSSNSSSSKVSGIYLGILDEVIDMDYLIRLKGEKTNAKINIQGALKDKAKKNFKGTIDFRKGSIKGIGLENEFCMLLSKEAKSKALPIMLCEEDYVEGNHSTACGKIDEDKLFYLMTRGFSQSDARKIIVKAKFEEIIEQIEDNNIKEEILLKVDSILEDDK